MKLFKKKKKWSCSGILCQWCIQSKWRFSSYRVKGFFFFFKAFNFLFHFIFYCYRFQRGHWRFKSILVALVGFGFCELETDNPSQKDSILSCYIFIVCMEFRKMVTISLYAKQKKRHRLTEQTFGLCGRRRGWMFRENRIKTCILSRVKQITSPGWMHETSARAWCTGKTQRDRVEREVGEGTGMGNTCIYGWFMSMYGKNHYTVVK